MATSSGLMESIWPGVPEGLDEGCGLSGAPSTRRLYGALELIRDRIKWCETEGVEFLCCPETVLGGLADDAQCPFEFAINAESGQLEALLAPLASKSVSAIVGFTETVGAGTLYNAAAVFHDGKVVGVYRKRYLFYGKRHSAIKGPCTAPGPKPGLYRWGSFVRDHDLQ